MLIKQMGQKVIPFIGLIGLFVIVGVLNPDFLAPMNAHSHVKKEEI